MVLNQNILKLKHSQTHSTVEALQMVLILQLLSPWRKITFILEKMGLQRKYLVVT